MDNRAPVMPEGQDQDAALHRILEGTASARGEEFFRALVANLSDALGTEGAWVATYNEEARHLTAYALRMCGAWVPDFAYDVAGTPCEQAIDGRRFFMVQDNILDLFPSDDMEAIGAVSYMGVPLLDLNDRVLGLLAVLDTRPMAEEPRSKALFHIFAARAAAELQRLRAEDEVREREEKLGRLVDSAMDAIIELDRNLTVTRINRAAEKVFHCQENEAAGQPFGKFLAEGQRTKLTDLVTELDERPEGERALWIPGGLTARRGDGSDFPAEATLSRYVIGREPYYSLILRNVNDRLEAERKINHLTREAQYLKEEITNLTGTEEIVGTSPAIRRVHADIAEVAGTDATVLVLGETGTGKELVARAIHKASLREDRPLIKVNCAAIPATLIESEFFGHEKGAFTGATEKREGRFSLADGGTIFLDEVGELPVDLQSKLLRVLQEGEFEPVGSSRTRKVDVRVITATNKDLKAEAENGAFREDLYYRLNVFPIHVPPLRERGDDICLLAEVFAARYAKRMGRTLEPPTDNCRQRLSGYSWPGNVRELQNVVERAVITSIDGRLNLDRALPGEKEAVASGPVPAAEQNDVVRTAQQMQQLERDNIRRALERTGWKVSGEKGAAGLLGMNPSTLTSRMKALGLSKDTR